MPKPAHDPLQAHDQHTFDEMRRVDVNLPQNWKVLLGFASRLGLTQREIAEVFPCAVSTVSRWQSGAAIPPDYVRAAMKDLLLDSLQKKLRVRRAA